MTHSTAYAPDSATSEGDAGRSPGAAPAPPQVLFVCVQNAGRSQMAAALLGRYAGDRVRVRSAGSAPADRVHPPVVAAMAELGFDLAGQRPRALSPDLVVEGTLVVTMGCGDACPVVPGARYRDWQLPDPSGRGLDEVRAVRDEIDGRVRALVAELTGASVPPVTVRAMTDADADAVLDIYREGIATGDATFETTVPDWETFRERALPGHRLVAADTEGAVRGWAMLSPVSGRCVYAGVAEDTVYVQPAAQGNGVGGALLRALIDGAERAGLWTLQAGIFPENTASVALHRAHGFRTVGRRERLGSQHGRWRDVLLLERRSPVVGVE